MGNQQGKAAEENDPQKKKREQVLEELVQTEKSYANYLSVIEDVYINPMSKKNVINKESHKELFATVQPIIQFHRDFFYELAISYNSFTWVTNPIPVTRTTTNDDGTTTVTTTTVAKTTGKKPANTFESIVAIVEIFNKNKNTFKIYSDYIVSYDGIIQTLSRLRKKSSVATFLDKCRSDPQSNGQDLNSLLIMPVQRLPRYVLLLSELLKSSPAGSPIIKTLESCISGIKNVTQFINEAKRDDENQNKLKELQDTLIDKVNVMEPNRKLYLNGECFIHSMYPMKEEDEILKRVHKYRKAKNNASMTESNIFPDEFKLAATYGFYVFNDSFILISKPPKSSLSNLINSSKVWIVNDCSLLKDTKVIDVMDIFNFKHALLLVTERSCYFIQMSNEENKQRLLKTIAMGRVDYKKNTADAAAATGESSSSSLPSLLTLRPQPGAKNAAPASSSTKSSVSLSASSSATTKKKDAPPASGGFFTLGKSSGTSAKK
ncbi:hypothetical protein SAMD00019534_004250 [Acytostelium subglobosum LB1]|uniref:hypothetical protein n=1 Tax=Acytostelium subglobosum LB1 TaxID=1410327 RepID=UPI0006452330|nr:hypothetical protein SAMD00019534_004250 [Acytostelium subglobosum LB1]GAM17250.1 hypothetical protein SAMD00019534_004250 [Acytostelium subglobosum LB1]|eukprot:XP_012759312.1 hypothetical protein SAMD00019534_004250 [Acytostelium subglobosum LB1]